MTAFECPDLCPELQASTHIHLEEQVPMNKLLKANYSIC